MRAIAPAAPPHLAAAPTGRGRRYAPRWGDWEEPTARFPGGASDAAASAARHGLTAGLWIAPFAADADSALVRAHPEWVLRTRPGGRPANAGFTAGVAPAPPLLLPLPMSLLYTTHVPTVSGPPGARRGGSARRG